MPGIAFEACGTLYHIKCFVIGMTYGDFSAHTDTSPPTKSRNYPQRFLATLNISKYLYQKYIMNAIDDLLWLKWKLQIIFSCSNPFAIWGTCGLPFPTNVCESILL